MRSKIDVRWAHGLAALCFIGVVMTGGVGCGDNDSDDDDPIALTPTPSPSPTPTEEPGPPHSLMRVGSTAVGSGTLAIQGDTAPTAFVVATACLGGTGEDCEGGTVVYSGTSPGFNDVLATDAAPPHPLTSDIEVRIEITALDADTSLGISGSTLDAVGEIAIINSSGHLHNHPQWQVVAPGGHDHPEPKQMKFRLHANGYTSSAEITVPIEVYEGQTGGEHHD